MPHEMYLKAFANALRVPYFIFKYGPAIIGQGNDEFFITIEFHCASVTFKLTNAY